MDTCALELDSERWGGFFLSISGAAGAPAAAPRCDNRCPSRSHARLQDRVPLRFPRVCELGQEPSHLLLWQVGSWPRPGPRAGMKEAARRVKGEGAPPSIPCRDSNEPGFRFAAHGFFSVRLLAGRPGRRAGGGASWVRLPGPAAGRAGPSERLGHFGVLSVCPWVFVVAAVLSCDPQSDFRKRKPSSQVQERSVLRTPRPPWGVTCGVGLGLPHELREIQVHSQPPWDPASLHLQRHCAWRFQGPVATSVTVPSRARGCGWPDPAAASGPRPQARRQAGTSASCHSGCFSTI